MGAGRRGREQPPFGFQAGLKGAFGRKETVDFEGGRKMKFWAKFETTPQEERMFHAIRVKASPSLNAISDSVIHDMAVLDSKSAALLSFISLVIAGLIFALGLVDGRAPDARLIRGTIFMFLSLFIYAAWIDLRCLHTLGPTNLSPNCDGDEFERICIVELSRRRIKYAFALFICETSFVLLIFFVILWVLVTFHVLVI
jgi:hypothetical protein